MNRVYTGDEVFQIAIEMEETGEVFYESLAVGSGKESIAGLCRRLADDERNHRLTFQRLRGSFAAEEAPRDMGEEDQAAVQRMLNEQVVPSAAEVRKVALHGDLNEALDLAIKLEEDSVAFYEGLLASVDGRAADAVAAIVKEEQKHVSNLQAARKDVRPASL
jgi:rubrerythrin